MKVYQMKLILGKEAQYNKDGKLKNQVITPKYTGEMELENMLDDLNWKKVGACEMSCIKVLDTDTNKEDISLMDSVNNRINDYIKAKEKPKSVKDLLEEQTKQNAALLERLEKLEQRKPIKPIEAKLETGFSESDRGVIESKANELGVSFRANIGTQKLLDKILINDPEFKL